MKNGYIIIILGLFFALNVVFAAPKEVCLQTDLHCGACKAKIEKTMKKTNGIINTNADVPTKIVKIKYETDKVSETKIISILKDLGYKAEIKQEIAPTPTKIEPDKKNNEDKLKSGRKSKESCCGK